MTQFRARCEFCGVITEEPTSKPKARARGESHNQMHATQDGARAIILLEEVVQ